MNDTNPSPAPGIACLDFEPDLLVERLLDRPRRLLLAGAPGSGKSTLIAELARRLAQAGRACAVLNADPGSPAIGLPGAVSLAVPEVQAEAMQWRILDAEALCTLDAGRFRLPLVTAVQRLAMQVTAQTLLIDGPGVVRGAAGAELLQGLLSVTRADLVLLLWRDGSMPPLLAELRAQGIEIVLVRAAPAARRPGKKLRARTRTALWDACLLQAVEQSVALQQLQVIGMPPPMAVPGAWVGRQVALSGSGQTVPGEVMAMGEGTLQLRLAAPVTSPRVLLVRDAWRSPAGWLETAPPYAGERLEYLPPPDVTPFARMTAAGGPWIHGEVGNASVTLVNGVFGDPLLYVRLRNRRRSLLFDLGASVRLAARVAHQVTDIFITHAHLDHIGGFLWLLRARVGDFPPCRLYGPPGLARHIEAQIQGILWDRIADRGPVFVITELHEQRLLRYRMQTGQGGLQYLGEATAAEGVLHAEPGFRIRAVTLDHGTPVLAYAFEPDLQVNIRKDRLRARGWAAGPWLAQLKQCVVTGNREAEIRLPDGGVLAAGALADELTLILPGRKLVYATDFADTRPNRERLTAFAQGAHTLFCEATFLEADAEQAQRTGHLTTRACGEIAAAARVSRLVPFHFSQRNRDRPEQVYEEIRAACPRVMAPKSMEVFVQTLQEDD